MHHTRRPHTRVEQANSRATVHRAHGISGTRMITTACPRGVR
jgi:hypothetical protein